MKAPAKVDRPGLSLKPKGRSQANDHRNRLSISPALTPQHPSADCFGSSTPLTANVPCTPHQTPTGLAAGGGRHAATIDHVHTRATRFTDLRDHARRMKRCECYCMGGRCDGQSKCSDTN